MTAGVELPEWDDWARRPYLVEIARQCAMAIRAAAQLDEALREEGLRLGAWFAAQAFLGATANVSKLLAPPRSSGTPTEVAWARLRGRKLCGLLGVDTNAPVLSRIVRNHFEHLDERIDAWLLSQPRLTAEEVEAGELQRLMDASPPPIRIIHAADGVIAYRDDELDVSAIVAELERILDVARRLEPLANVDPGLGALLAALPPYPPELQLSAPSRRPDEPVTAGMDQEAVSSFDDALRDALHQAAEAFEAVRDDDRREEL